MVAEWPLIGTETAADLGLFQVRRDRALSPRTGAAHDFLVVRMADWLAVAPFTEAGRLLLVRQYRHGNRRVGLELPGGLLDVEDTDPAVGGERELLEETGFGGGRIEQVGSFNPQPALIGNRVHLLLARDLRRLAEPAPDHGEDLETVEVEPRELDRLIGDGEIHSGVTLAALALLRALPQGAGLLP